MATDRSVTLDVHLMGRDYKVACREDERADLLEAVPTSTSACARSASASKTAGADRIVVMAALNIANELLRERKAPHAAGADADGDVVPARVDPVDARRDRAGVGRAGETFLISSGPHLDQCSLGCSSWPDTSLNQCSRSEVAEPLCELVCAPYAEAP